MLIVVYRDTLGIVEQCADYNAISFLNGYAIFSVECIEYKIPIENLIEIVTD